MIDRSLIAFKSKDEFDFLEFPRLDEGQGPIGKPEIHCFVQVIGPFVESLKIHPGFRMPQKYFHILSELESLGCDLLVARHRFLPHYSDSNPTKERRSAETPSERLLRAIVSKVDEEHSCLP
jgi:hypothetical protein